MKKILLILFMLIPFLGMSQSIANPDTVCYQTPGSVYSVTPSPGTTYTWSVATPGVITAGQGSSSITVDWSGANPGLINNAVTVTASNSFGCDTSTIVSVYIFNTPPTFTTSTVCASAACIPLVGTPSGGVFTGPGVTGSYQFCPSLAGVGSHTITYTYTVGGCVFTTTGSGPFVVNPAPTITPISHN